MKNEQWLLEKCNLNNKMEWTYIKRGSIACYSKDALEPVQNAANNKRILLVDLPVNEQELNGILKNVAAVFCNAYELIIGDAEAQTLINKQPVFASPKVPKIKSQGFVIVTRYRTTLKF